MLFIDFEENIMQNETVTIILPLPSPYLSPNRPPGSKGSRIRKATIAKAYRKQAREVTLEQCIDETWEKATIKAKFYHAQKRRRDSLNFMSSLKSAIDGVVDAGLLKDDDSTCLTPLPPTFEIDKENPRVELLFTRC
jgi:hypothetical protein